MRLPSIKELQHSFPYLPTCRGGAKEIREILEKYYEHPEIALYKIDRILVTRGLSYFHDMKDNENRYGILFCRADGEYVKGCARATTLIYDYDKGNYYIGCVGDVLARQPRRFNFMP